MENQIFNQFIKNVGYSKVEDTVYMYWKFGEIEFEVSLCDNYMNTKIDFTEEQFEEVYLILNQYDEENENEQEDTFLQPFTYADYTHFESLIHA